MPQLSEQQKKELNIASQRVGAGTPGVATDSNAGDVANLAFAKDKYGFTPGAVNNVEPDPNSNEANMAKIMAIGNAPVISDGTDDLEDQMKSNLNDLNSSKTDTESTSSVIDRLTKEREAINSESSSELDRIKEAGERAGAAYDTYVQDAEFARKQTLPQDIVRAGQKGGFESTQMAGAAAISPTAGKTGESFVGAGGVLDEQRQSLDRNLSLVRAKQQEAIAAAEAAERQYIKTGKQEDYNAAIDLVKLANDMENDKETISMNRQRLMMDVAQEERAQTKFEYDIISSIPEGETRNIGGLDYTGIATGDVDPFFTGSNIISLMKSLPAGTTQELTDPNTGNVMTIAGLETEDPNIKTIQSTSDTGEVTITSYRLTPDGGAEVINQAGAGRIGKTKTKAANVSIFQQGQQAGALGDAKAKLEAGKGADGYYNTDDAIAEVSEYSITNPGKRKQIIDVIKNNLNPNDPKAKQLITGKVETDGGGGIEITNPSGVKFKIN